MSLLKYFGQQGAEHGGVLKWLPTSEGLPPLRNYPGSAITRQELDNVETVADFHCRWFDLNNEEDRQAYVEVRDRGLSGLYIMLHIDRTQFDKGRIYVEWSQVYGEVPNVRIPGIRQEHPEHYFG